MALTINTNVPSLNAQRNLSKSQNDLSQAMQRLSSGLRINSAKDDAAGLAISDRMTSQIRGLNQAARNANDGISLAQTAEGALQETTNILQRMRELAVQSANDTNSASDRSSLQAEVNQLNAEMQRIAESTEFNGGKLLNGDMSNAQFQVGPNAGDTITFSIRTATPGTLGNNSLTTDNATPDFSIEAATSAAAGVQDNDVLAQTLTISGPEGTETASFAAASTANVIAGKINNETDVTGVSATAKTTATLGNLSADGTIGFKLQGSNATATSISATVTTTDLTNLARAVNEQSGNTGIIAILSPDKATVTLEQSNGYDVKIIDFTHTTATETIDLTGSQGAGEALTAGGLNSSTVGGELTFSSSGDFNVSSGAAPGAGSLFAAAAGTATSSTLFSINSVDISTVEGASKAILAVDGALMQIDNMRGGLGAIQNRFESTISNLLNVSENLSAARSRILDADIAMETSAMTKNNILQQAGVSILAQANQTPQLALSLLQG